MNTIKKIKPYLINGLSVILIFLIILFLSKTYPFGNTILGKIDAIAQFKPMLYNFIMNIKIGNLHPFYFNNGLGNSILFDYIFYNISPLNLIAILFKNPNSMYLSVILIKLFFTAVNTTFYAKKKNASDLVSFIASVTYVYSSWVLSYYYNTMWLDTLMIFPLIQYGLEQLTEKNKGILLIFSLAYAFATNIYLTLYILIYSIIYFIIRNFFYENKELIEKIKTTMIFLLSVLLSILLISVVIDMMVIVKKQTGLVLSTPEKSSFFLTTANFFKSLLYGNYDLSTTLTQSTFPNLAINSIALISIFYTFFNKKISTKDKLYIFIGLVLVILSIFIKKIDYIAILFNNVVNLTYQYTFIFSFLATILLIKNLNTLNKKDIKKVVPIAICLIIIVIILNKNITKATMILNICSLIAIIAMALLYSENKYYKIIPILLILFQTIFIGYKIIPNTNHLDEKIDYNYKKETSTYRLNVIGLENEYLNKNLYTNDKVTYLFTSMTYNDVLYMVNGMGCSSGGNSITCNDNNPIFNMLFNVKNDYYLEKIYSVNDSIKEAYANDSNTKYTQENTIEKMTNITDIYDEKKLEGTFEDNIFVFNIEQDYYLIKDGDDIYPLYVDEVESPLNIITIYTINENKLKEVYDYLSKNQIKYTHYEDHFIEGKINVDENQMIFTSIPYDEAWEIKIDGEKVKPNKLLGSLIGIETTPGEHELSMRYKYNFTKSIIISATTFIALIVYMIIKKKKA